MKCDQEKQALKNYLGKFLPSFKHKKIQQFYRSNSIGFFYAAFCFLAREKQGSCLEFQFPPLRLAFPPSVCTDGRAYADATITSHSNSVLTRNTKALPTEVVSEGKK